MLRIISMEIEAFRGYTGSYRFDFSNADIIILYGPNGHGKTSFFDAIEWALTGHIYRYSEPSDERNQSRFIGNQFTVKQPSVTLRLWNEVDHSDIIVKRTGTAGPGALSDYGIHWLNVEIRHNGDVFSYEGSDAENVLISLLIRPEWMGKVDLNRTLNLTHLLGQDRIHDVLRNMKDSERYSSISQIFGTEHFRNFQKIISEAKGKLETRLHENVDSLNRVNTEIETTKSNIELIRKKLVHAPEEYELFKQIVYSYAQRHQINIENQVEQGYKLIRQSISARMEDLKHQQDQSSRELTKITRIQSFIPSLLQAIREESAAQEQLSLLVKAKEIQQKIVDIVWLQEREDWFTQASESIRLLEQQYSSNLILSNNLAKEARDMREFVKVVKESFESAWNIKEFSGTVELVREFVGIQSEIKDKTVQYIQSIDGALKQM